MTHLWSYNIYTVI